MWDQQKVGSCDSFSSRIIPTYVGSTATITKSRLNISNHSHVCGINSWRVSVRVSGSESFPRMWDQPILVHDLVNSVRIIPTYVGSTQQFSALPERHPNHSHVCGINSHFFWHSSTSAESFPRMWDQRGLAV